MSAPILLAPDGAWTWFNDPRALLRDGVLYYGFMRQADGRAILRSFDLATRQIHDLWTSSWSETDDHNNPSLVALPGEGLLALYARHAGDATTFEFRHATGPRPVHSDDWGAEARFTSPERITYTNPFCLPEEDHRIYQFMRNLNFNPTWVTSGDGGRTWTPPRLLIHTGLDHSVRPYVKYASDGQGRIDFLYTDGHPRDAANSLYHAYYHDLALHASDGAILKPWAETPLQHDAGERGTVIYAYSDAPALSPDDHIPGGRAWCWDVVAGPNHCPACVFTVQVDEASGPGWTGDRIYYYYARWTPGRGWQKKFIAHAGRPLYEEEDDYAGGICLDPTDPSVVYLSTNAAHPFDLDSTREVHLQVEKRYVLYRGVTDDGGLSFHWQRVTEPCDADQLRPYVARNGDGSEKVLLWMQGRYQSYTHWETSLQAQILTPCPV